MTNVASQIADLRDELEKIKARNRKVEADKAWETSRTRTSFIALSTYLVILIFMLVTRDNHPFLNAFIATIGYLISTATYGVLKRWWLDKKASTER